MVTARALSELKVSKSGFIEVVHLIKNEVVDCAEKKREALALKLGAPMHFPRIWHAKNDRGLSYLRKY